MSADKKRKEVVVRLELGKQLFLWAETDHKSVFDQAVTTVSIELQIYATYSQALCSFSVSDSLSLAGHNFT